MNIPPLNSQSGSDWEANLKKYLLDVQYMFTALSMQMMEHYSQSVQI